MSYLRVMTFNVQLLPSVPATSSPGNEAEARAYNIGKSIAALASDERPDVLVCNEVFSEDGRDELIRHLQPLYPVILSKLDDCFIGQDSGLLLASRLPLKPLRNGRDQYFYSFDASAGHDSLACKGVCIVRLDADFGEITLAFTHTQASYNYEDQYQQEREDQFIELSKQIDYIAGSNWPPGVLLVGDLNVRGDPGASGTEWTQLFAVPNGRIGRALDDGWRTFMHPPGQKETDPGYTNNNLAEGTNGHLPRGLLMRLDYFCFVRRADQRIVPQHMRTRFRSLSDHWSLESDIHLASPNCTPADALVLGEPGTTDVGPLRVVEFNVVHEGSFQWIYVRDAGTYSVLADPSLDLDVTVYSESDLSNPWQPYGKSSLKAMGVNEILEIGRRLNLGDTALQYDLPGPFFVRIKAARRFGGFTGSAKLGLYLHEGRTPETAIRLRSFEPAKDPALPDGRPLGQFDECWFRADLDTAYTKAPVASTFVLENGSPNSAELTLCDSSLNPLVPTVSGLGTVEIRFSSVGPEVVFLKLKRKLLTDTNFRVGWKCALTYLRSVANVRPMVLRCKDETGVDAFGGDEITLTLFADGTSSAEQFHEEVWDDADTDEILKLEGKMPEIAFVNYVEAQIYEADFIAEGPDTGRVPALSDADPLVKPVVVDISVQSGTYSFECTLARHRQI